MLTYPQIAGAIESEGRKIGHLVEEYRAASDAAAQAEADYKVAHAAARLSYRELAAEGGWKPTADQADDYATVEASVSLRNYLSAREAHGAIREALRGAQSRMEGLRSLAAGSRPA